MGSLTRTVFALLVAPLSALGVVRLDHGQPPHRPKAHVDTDDANELHTPRERLLWKQALQEAPAIKKESITDFGNKAAKYPKSWVDKIVAMDHTKKYRFNFQGSGFTIRQQHHRKWLMKFVRAHFDERDYLRFTDPPKHYQSMGVFDHTLSNEPGGIHPKKAQGSQKGEFDAHYYQLMASSNFTLCPGGDTPWSMRLYEAALSGSVPVIHSVAGDFTPPPRAAWLPKIGYEYRLTSPSMEYSQEAVDKNLRLFMRYQTFLDGDNDPTAASEHAAASSPNATETQATGDNSTGGAGNGAAEAPGVPEATGDNSTGGAGNGAAEAPGVPEVSPANRDDANLVVIADTRTASSVPAKGLTSDDDLRLVEQLLTRELEHPTSQ